MLFGIAFGVYTGMGFIIVLSRFYHFSTAIRFVISIPPWPVRGDLGVYGGVYSIRYAGQAPMAQGEWGEFTRPKKICLRGEHTSALFGSNNTMILL